MSPLPAHSALSQIATDILRACNAIEGEYESQDLVKSSGASWTGESPTTSAQRSKLVGLLGKLTSLAQGTHEYLHEFVASNWDHGALYTCLQSGLLQSIAATNGRATLAQLSKECRIPGDKLLRILGLLRCKDFVDEPEQGVYTLTPVSHELLVDECFREWVEFQLFETRIASAYLADTLSSQPNTYDDGSSAFRTAFGTEMYEWHQAHPNKGERFRQAMRGVSASLDPADSLLRKWFSENPVSSRTKVVELGGRYGFASVVLAESFPDITFEVRSDTEAFLEQGAKVVKPESKDRITFTTLPSLSAFMSEEDKSTVHVYVIRNVFWNWKDNDAAEALKHLIFGSQKSSGIKVLITDGVSPLGGEFEPHIEIAYRRRDITTMAMHNVKQRTQKEWLGLFAMVHPEVQIKTYRENSSHVCKALWELSL